MIHNLIKNSFLKGLLHEVASCLEKNGLWISKASEQSSEF